jgi:hypothetical protein
MAPTIETTKQFLFNMRLKGEFTFDEAVKAMEVLDSLPGGNSNQIHWVNSKTYKSVSVGYNR